MSDPPGLPAALGIEAVECVVESGGEVTVRVTGRWWRRRPEWRGQVLLLVEAHGTRHRFAAVPEPPSLTSTVPGRWRMSFSVPGELASDLGERTWIQLGTVVARLPIPTEVAVGSASRAGQPAGRPPAGAPEVTEGAGVDPHAADAEPVEIDRLLALLSRRQRELQHAQRRLHAESAMRAELEEELGGRERRLGEAQRRVRTLESRVRELERDLLRLRRAADEAEHEADAARAAQARAERARGELEAASGERAARATQGDADALARATREAERQRTGREEAERRAAAVQRQLARQHERCTRAFEAIGELRATLSELWPAADDLDAGPETDSEPVQADRLSDALARLREKAPPREPGDGEPDAPASEPPAPPAAEPPPAASEPPVPPAAEPPPAAGPPSQPVATSPSSPWLGRTFRALVARDPVSAGRLAVHLLPAQGLVTPRPVAYDLVLTDLGCVWVTVAGGGAEVEFAEGPRGLGAVQFRVSGDLAGLGRLLAAGWLRRRLGLGVARVRGARHGDRVLRALVEAPLTLNQLSAAGVRLPPALALQMVASTIDPKWTLGQRFMVACQAAGASEPSAFLHVRDGEAVTSSDTPPPRPAQTTIIAAPGMLLPTLAGDRPPGATVMGEELPLALLAGWLERSQRG